MDGWQFVAIGESLERVTRPDPQPGPGEAVIDVRAAGLCRSDVDLLERGPARHVGLILGHEIAGIVSDVDVDVDTVAPGDRVAVCPTASGPLPGYFRDGGFATRHVAPAADLVAVPANVNLSIAATMTDAGMTPYHALVARGGLHAGMRVGLIGLGGLGQVAAQIAVLQGAEVHVADPRPTVQPLATALGVASLVPDASEWPRGGFDLVVDLAGFGATVNAALRAVRPEGTVVLVGMGEPRAELDIELLITRRLDLRGSQGGTSQDIAALLAHVARGDISPAITEIGFDDIPRGLADLAAGRVTGRLVALRGP